MKGRERFLPTEISHIDPLNRSDFPSPYLPLPYLSHRFAENGWGEGWACSKMRRPRAPKATVARGSVVGWKRGLTWEGFGAL